MYVASEKVAWFDPALLRLGQVTSSVDDFLEVREVVTTAVRRRFEETLTDCALNSSSVHAAAREFYNTMEGRRGVAAAIGCRVERPACPIDHSMEPLAHVVVAGGTYAAVTEPVPQHLYFFDQRNDIAISCLKLACGGRTSEKTPTADNFFIDECDVVAALFLEPRGNFCVVRWRSGKAAYYHIPRRSSGHSRDYYHCHRPQSEGWPAEDVKSSEDEERLESDMMPRRFPLQFCANVTGMLRPFYVECIAWDPNNTSDTTTGDVILGSSSGGILLACRLETHGIVAARRLYQFPQPYSSYPIDSVAYMTDLQSPEHPRRHVVLVAQNTRLFVFCSLWGQSSSLEAAFDTSLLDCKNVVSNSTAAFSCAVSSPLSGGVSSSSGGGLMNYISVSNGATTTTATATIPSSFFSSSASVGCRHRALSSTVAPADASVLHEGPEASRPRLLSCVVILHSRELLPTLPSASPAPSAGGREGASSRGEAGANSPPTVATDKLPPVFFWQYGDTLTHGIILLTDLARTAGVEASQATTHASTLMHRQEGYCSPAMRSPRPTSPFNTRLPLNVWQSLLPVGILSVVSLARLMQDFSALLQSQQGGTQRPPMFRRVPVGADENVAAVCTPPRPLGVGDVERLLVLRHGGRHGVGGCFTLPSLTTPSLKRNSGFCLKGEELRPSEGELQTAEKLVSVAMGYGHIVLTTTRAVHVFCHFAALPLPQEAFQWKNALVFTQELVASAMGNTATGTRGDGVVTVFCSHDVGCSQVFHLFSATYIFDLRLCRRRCRAQHVAQLVDAVNNVGAGTVQRGPAEKDELESTHGCEARTTGRDRQQ
ncbi:hypothetical protein TRSC58_00031 [Trypanosoma rangeli SC58]|uniref:Pep3/Vps18 beta-propeller domain-containing protein n=1 Tax=Trypanosoma rangeli SC58 TaxID=429131 RepID=A0A061JCU6_TRYRA|nr:hypothetical protein TRSC58_00031 [Trypanosoma rangeli SC58]